MSKSSKSVKTQALASAQATEPTIPQQVATPQPLFRPLLGQGAPKWSVSLLQADLVKTLEAKQVGLTQAALVAHRNLWASQVGPKAHQTQVVLSCKVLADAGLTLADCQAAFGSSLCWNEGTDQGWEDGVLVVVVYWTTKPLMAGLAKPVVVEMNSTNGSAL